MPVTKSARKALRQSRRKREVNLALRQKTKQALKKARQKPTRISKTKAISLLDRAAKKKIIHRNKAARLKSKLAKLKATKKKKTIPAKKKKKT